MGVLSLRSLQNALCEAEGLGVRVLDNGTRLIGHVPHVAPEAYLHVVFAGLSNEQCDEVESLLRDTVPDTYRSFLLEANGIWLFNGALMLDGLRESFARTGDAAWQPMSIVTPNTVERPRGAARSWCFVGWYEYDGSHLVIDRRSERVIRCSADAHETLNEWEDLPTMIDEEVRRLEELFDAGGKQVEPGAPTTPERSS